MLSRIKKLCVFFTLVFLLLIKPAYAVTTSMNPDGVFSNTTEEELFLTEVARNYIRVINQGTLSAPRWYCEFIPGNDFNMCDFEQGNSSDIISIRCDANGCLEYDRFLDFGSFSPQTN